ncbi:MAG: lytic transglycosylase domain-containing protein [Candidatus Aminicenantes bacterium]|nr:lytic transglycosylase domain-containing protein [Candidatus Aminicenantes bacterium]
MLKQNLRKSVYTLLILLVVGLTGLWMALADFNSNYLKNRQALYMMSNEVMQLEKKVSSDNWKLKNYDFLEYKLNAYEKKYPKFSKIVDAVYRKSNQYGFHPDLVLGIVQVESNYNPNAISWAGAYGLMQVNLSVWKNELSIDEDNILNIDYNIDLGLQILKRYFIESNGNMERALHLYNNGYKYNNTSYIGKVSRSLVSLNGNRKNIAPMSN